MSAAIQVIVCCPSPNSGYLESYYTGMYLLTGVELSLRGLFEYCKRQKFSNSHSNWNSCDVVQWSSNIAQSTAIKEWCDVGAFHTENIDLITVSMLVHNFSAKSIRFLLVATPPPASTIVQPVKTNAFGLMMRAAEIRNICDRLPEAAKEFDTFSPPRPIPENIIFNSLISYLRKNKLGFTSDAMLDTTSPNSPHKFIKTLSSCFLKLKYFYSNLRDTRILQSVHNQIPEEFEVFFEKKSIIKSILTTELLTEVDNILSSLLDNSLFLRMKTWSNFKEKMQCFFGAIQKYKEYNAKNTARKLKNNGLKKDSIFMNNFQLTEIENVSEDQAIDLNYINLNDIVNLIPVYTTMSLMDYIPHDSDDSKFKRRKLRDSYLCNLQLEVPIILVTYDTKNRLLL